MQTASSVLILEWRNRAELVAHCLRALPDEGCGLLLGDTGLGRVTQLWPERNVAASARLYEVDPKDLLQADRAAEAQGQQIIGVFHSHTHTDPYPSPTDVAQAPDPTWHYVIVSLRFGVPSLRSFRIVEGAIIEEPILPEENTKENGSEQDRNHLR